MCKERKLANAAGAIERLDRENKLLAERRDALREALENIIAYIPLEYVGGYITVTLPRADVDQARAAIAATKPE